MFDVTSGETLTVLPGGCGIHSPDGKHILYVKKDKTGKKNTIVICDALTGEETDSLEGHAAPIRDFTITADCQRVISLDSNRMISVWNLRTGVQLLNLRTPEGYRGGHLRVGPHGRNLAFNFQHSKIWFTKKRTQARE